MSKALRAELAERLLGGQDGLEVAELMRTHTSAFKTACSLRSGISTIRRAILESGDPRALHPQHKATVAALRRRAGRLDVAPECRAKVAEFAAASLREQYRTHRQHARKKLCLGNAAVDAALRAVRLLPDSMASFQASAEEAGDCRRADAATTLRRNNAVLIVHGAQRFVDRALEILRTCDERTCFGALGYALLLASGRRTGEVFNMKSTFSRGPVPHSAHFQGQLKRHGADRGYDIPLLSTFAEFTRALAVLRLKQARHPPRDNAHVNTLYAANLRRAVQREFMPGTSAHVLRRFYAMATWQSFRYDETPVTYNSMVLCFLGHSDLAMSLSYNDIRLLGLTHRLPGRLPVGAEAA
jgi:hypothetical protein